MTWHNPYPEMWIPHDPSGTEPLELTRRALDRIVKGVLGDHPAVKVETSAIEGPPARVLTETAKGAEMLVVGNRGLNEFVEILLGSVSLHCVSHAPCPVVVVR
jgi:nucleotide-binding universal stress UspA family protein